MSISSTNPLDLECISRVIGIEFKEESQLRVILGERDSTVIKNDEGYVEVDNRSRWKMSVCDSLAKTLMLIGDNHEHVFPIPFDLYRKLEALAENHRQKRAFDMLGRMKTRFDREQAAKLENQS